VSVGKDPLTECKTSQFRRALGATVTTLAVVEVILSPRTLQHPNLRRLFDSDYDNDCVRI